MNLRKTLKLLVAGCALACTACANREIEQGFARRVQNLEKTTGWLIESEQRRPANLEKTASVIDEQHQRDMQKTFEDNPATMQRWFNEEFRRWQERQPAYLKAIGEELSGDLESLERTVPYIVN